MDQRQTVSSRRNRLRPTSTGKRVSAQDRDLLWFAKLAEHGPLPTSFLLEYSRHTHKSEKRAKERLTDLFNEANTPHHGPYLTRPLQQFRTIDSRHNQLVYDLGLPAIAALENCSSIGCRSHSGPWLHRFMLACVTASIELACRQRHDIKYIPQSMILARAEVDLRWPTKITDPKSGATFVKDLIPDAVFGLEYHSGESRKFRFFVVEVDRATEPATSSNFHRKSFERHLLQYAEYIEGGGYREHLNLTAPMLVLNVTTNLSRRTRMQEVLDEIYPAGNAYQLFQTWDAFGPVFCPPRPNPALLIGDWARAGYQALRLDEK
ncbi:replication-relaxation family protein [Parerythrobacter aestuarii]|uniref:replication-relaxation family protein n=1 Tax=Parerythrobacter aestuarii TaxID=3020909 RepID=UPI0024DEFA3C|nr:replication-relaxation family protein [Parerythrobacter aestuarii]